MREKTYIREFANEEGSGQSAHPRSLISIFVIRLIERIISRYDCTPLASLCSRGDLSLAVSEPPKIGYVASGPILSNGP